MVMAPLIWKKTNLFLINLLKSPFLEIFFIFILENNLYKFNPYKTKWQKD